MTQNIVVLSERGTKVLIKELTKHYRASLITSQIAFIGSLLYSLYLLKENDILRRKLNENTTVNNVFNAD